MTISESFPAIFTVNGSGSGQAVALNEDGTVNSAANPAKGGSLVRLFGTGFPVDSTLPDGQIALADGPDVSDKRYPQIYFDALPASFIGPLGTAIFSYAGQAANFVQGIDRMEVRIPAVATTRPLVALRLSFASGATPYIAVQ